MRSVKEQPMWMKIMMGIVGASTFIGGPVAALVFMDSRHVTVEQNEWSEGQIRLKLGEVETAIGSVEKIMMEKRVDETKDQCDAEQDPMRKATYCERYRQYKSQLCQKYPESWLC